MYTALTFTQVHDVTIPVSNKLDFDMTGRRNGLLNIHPAIAKSAPGFTTSGAQGRTQVFRVTHKANTFPSTACSGFEQHGIA